MTVMTESPTERLVSTKYDLVPLNPVLATQLPELDDALLSGSLLPDPQAQGLLRAALGSPLVLRSHQPGYRYGLPGRPPDFIVLVLPATNRPSPS